MYWGAVRSDGKKMLVRCPDNMKNSNYLENLQKYEERMHFPGLIFQHDNAPVHKARIIQQFLAEKNWEVLEWPAYSPDLNIIENLWAIVKKRLQKQTVFWENLDEKVMEIWSQITQETVINLFNSVENRLKLAHKAKGNPIGYQLLLISVLFTSFSFICVILN